MKGQLKRKASLLALILLCLALCVFAAACGQSDEKPAPDPTPPVKVSDGVDFELAVGKNKNLVVADYITENDYTATATSSGEHATATISEGLMTVTGVSEGEATVTLACEDITVTFDVTVFVEYKVSVDGAITAVRKGGSFTLPAAPAIADPDMEFDYWLVGEEHKNPADSITVNGDVTVTSVKKRKAAEKVKAGDPVEVPLGAAKKLNVAEYITTHGATVTADSNNNEVVVASVDGDKIVFTPKASGTATVTVVCGTVQIEFAVTVTTVVVTYKVTVDGKEVATVNAGGSYTLPQEITPSDPDFEFAGWNVDGEVKQPSEEITVDKDLDITAELERKAAVKVKDGDNVSLSVDVTAQAQLNIADYITTHGRGVQAASSDESKVTAKIDGGKLILKAVASGTAAVTLTCSSITVTFNVSVTSTADGMPVFKNGTISFDLLEKSSDSYTFEIVEPAGSHFSYEYSVDPATGVTINENTLTYAATGEVSNLVLTVSVTATDETLGEKTASFTVTVNVTDSTPTAKNAAITDETTRDIYDGDITIDLSENMNYPENVASYKVNGAEVQDPTHYIVTGNDFTDTAKPVVLEVQAIVTDKSPVTYTYTLNVMDSTAYRMPNGGFDGDNHGAGWTGMTGTFSNVDTYFEANHPMNNDDYYYVGVDEGTETIISPEFKVGNSGWVTFKLGSMRPYDGTTVRDIYLSVCEKDEGGNFISIAKVSNVLFKDPERALKLNAYKLNLSSYKGKTVRFEIVDNENGDNFRSIYLDSFNTWWNADPGADYTDLTKPYALDTELAIDLAGESNVDEIVPIPYSIGLAVDRQITVTVKDNKEGITLETDEDGNSTVTATKPGDYAVEYTVDGEKLFTATVHVVYSATIADIDDIDKSFEYSEWFDTAAKQVSLTMPTTGSESLAYDFTIKTVTGGASAESFTIEGGELKYTPSGTGNITLTVEAAVKVTKFTPAATVGTKEFTVTLRFLDNTISLKGGDAITLTHDVNDLTDKEKLVLNFANYINVPSDKTAAYSVKLGEQTVELTESSKYTITFAGEALSDEAKQYVFAVTATEGETTLNYTVTLNLTDTYQYRVKNGGFETGDLTDWTAPAGMGSVSNESTYWSGVNYQKDGNWFYLGNENKAEENRGALVSSEFKIGGSGFITFRLGAAGHATHQYVEVFKTVSGVETVLARYFNVEYADRGGFDGEPDKGNANKLSAQTLIKYKADLTAHKGEIVRLRVVDKWESGGVGYVHFDDLVTYYSDSATIDDSYTLAHNYVYSVYNGSFETGDLSGWLMNGDLGFVLDNELTGVNWYQINDESTRDGSYLFTFVNANGDNKENNIGSMRSSLFNLKSNGIVSFRMGAAYPSTVYIRLCRADGTELARFRNNAYTEATKMVHYYYQCDNAEETVCYFEMMDETNDLSVGGYRCIVMDDFRVNLEQVPTGAVLGSALTKAERDGQQQQQ